MKVKLTHGGEAVDVNNSYGMRLIEQGKAVLLPPEKKPAAAKVAKAKETAEQPAGEAK
ncbi:MAG: hypothetical protein LLF96_01300 [Eubacteriales bacterium]|nr:hypothetical protein [Eubacteriales bacterium]